MFEPQDATLTPFGLKLFLKVLKVHAIPYGACAVHVSVAQTQRT
jgi:hypothetical protein